MRKLLLAAGCLLLVGGCASHSQSSSTLSPEVERARPARTDVVARQAHLPIDYLITTKRTVRIDDASTGRSIWRRRLGANSQLRIAADGIRVNSKHVYSRKLKKGDMYEIVLVGK